MFACELQTSPCSVILLYRMFLYYLPGIFFILFKLHFEDLLMTLASVLQTKKTSLVLKRWTIFPHENITVSVDTRSIKRNKSSLQNRHYNQLTLLFLHLLQKANWKKYTHTHTHAHNHLCPKTDFQNLNANRNSFKIWVYRSPYLSKGIRVDGFDRSTSSIIFDMRSTKRTVQSAKSFSP